MGYTILLQWTVATPRSSTPQSDIIINRVLEHYQIQFTTRTNISIKTFKARAKILSMYQYIIMNRDNEDIAYLLLEDKSTTVNTDTHDESRAQTGDAEISEFINVDTPRVDQEEEGRERKRRKHTPYQTIAVKPSGAVVPMLQNLLNPFVMGISKAARQAASTTAQKATPTALAPTTNTVPGFLFPPLTDPFPPVTLTLHSPNTTGSARHTLLEAEYNGHLSDVKVVKSILREFLEGCIPEGAGGEYKWYTPPETDGDGWEGAERQRRLTLLLGRCMREGGL